MVKRYLGVDPGVVLLETFPLVVNNTDWQPGVVLVNTLVELSTKKLNSHDWEYQPEDQAHQQDIDDGGDGVHQGIYYNLEETVKSFHIIFIIIPFSTLNKLVASVLENFMERRRRKKRQWI